MTATLEIEVTGYYEAHRISLKVIGVEPMKENVGQNLMMFEPRRLVIEYSRQKVDSEWEWKAKLTGPTIKTDGKPGLREGSSSWWSEDRGEPSWVMQAIQAHWPKWSRR